MRAEFNNAKNGKTVGLMSTSSTTTTIDNLVSTSQNLTNYILKTNNGQHYYEIDTNYSTNVQVISNDYIIDLYQITAI